MNRANILKRLEMAENRKISGISKEAIKEIERYMLENQEEEEKKHKIFYEEVKKIGAQREAAYKRGEDMRLYPLPWETVQGIEKELKENEEAKKLFSSMGLDISNLIEVEERLKKELEARKKFESRGKEAK